MKYIHEMLHETPGYLAVQAISLKDWGSEIVFDCTYSHPPLLKRFRLLFHDCRGIEWTVIRQPAAGEDEAQVLTHDLGEPNHQHTARIATVLAEVILSYGSLTLEMA